MAPRSTAYKQLRRRMRRTLNYGHLHMNTLTIPLSKMVVDYFDQNCPYDYMNLDFAVSLSRDCCIDPYTLIVALCYVDRMKKNDQKYFEESDPSDLYLSALVVASKFLHDGGLDEFIWNDEWAASSSKSLQRVNELELKILDVLKWKLMVTDNEFYDRLDFVESWIARQSLEQNKFLTYNEINVLVKNFHDFWKHLEAILIFLGCLTTVYAAAVVFCFTIVPSLLVRTSSPALPVNDTGLCFDKASLQRDLCLNEVVMPSENLRMPIKNAQKLHLDMDMNTLTRIIPEKQDPMQDFTSNLATLNLKNLENLDIYEFCNFSNPILDLVGFQGSNFRLLSAIS